MTTLVTWSGTPVLVAEAVGPGVGGREVRDLVAEAIGAGATVVALPVGRLEPAFFDLRSGVAGDILQVAATYRTRLAIVGERPEPAASSAAFAALIRESNAGTQHWFLPSLDALRERLEHAHTRAPDRDPGRP